MPRDRHSNNPLLIVAQYTPIRGDAKRSALAGRSAAALEASLLAGVARVLTFTKELGVAHDRLIRVVRLAVRDVVVVVRNTHHEPGGLNRPPPQNLDSRHCQPPTAAPDVPPISIAVPCGELNALRISTMA